MILGFTGTREQPTPEQIRQLGFYLFDNGIEQVHHGACRGADAEMHRLALQYVLRIVVHPPLKMHNMMMPDWNHGNVTVLPHKDYHPRNRDIVAACDRLLVMPNGPWRPHSGTWSTHDYAVLHGVPRDIIWPDGQLEFRP